MHGETGSAWDGTGLCYPAPTHFHEARARDVPGHATRSMDTTARSDRVNRQRGRCGTPCGSRTAEADGGDRFPQQRLARATSCVPPGTGRNRLRRRTECSDRIPLGGGKLRSPPRVGRRSGGSQGRHDRHGRRHRLGASSKSRNRDDPDRLPERHRSGRGSSGCKLRPPWRQRHGFRHNQRRADTSNGSTC